MPFSTAPLATAEGPAASSDNVVTGSRIGGRFQTPTPLTVLTNKRAKALVVSNMGDALNQAGR